MIGLDRRRPVFGREMIMRVVAVWLCAALLSLPFGWSGLTALDLPGPDDSLRLVQVRDLLAGQSWFDLTQYRIDSANGGIPMHWSRLVDVPLAGLIAALSPLIGQNAAEMTALAIVPLLTLLCAMLLAARISWRMLGIRSVMATCLLIAVAAPLVGQMRIGRIDHHGWQIVLALVAMNAMIARDPRKGGIVLGIALAAWMAISIEGLPLAGVFIGLAALRWLRDPQDDGLMTFAASTLAGASALLYVFTRGFLDLATYCDAIGPIHLAAFTVAAAGLALLARIEPQQPLVRFSGLAVVAIAAIAVLGLGAPACATGGFAQIDPVVRDGWLASISEGLPMWKQQPAIVLLALVPTVIGICGMLHHASLTYAWVRRFWLEYAALTVAALALAMLVSRAGAYAVAFAVPVLGWQIVHWIEVLRTSPFVGQRIAAIAGCTLILVPALPFTLGALLADNSGRAQPVSGPAIVENCITDWDKLAGTVSAGEEILAPLDLGPPILLHTPVSVVATGHHRGDAGIKAELEIFASSPDEARRRLADRGTVWIASCAAHHELYTYGLGEPNSLAGALRTGNAPAWLEPVIAPSDPERVTLWRISRE